MIAVECIINIVLLMTGYICFLHRIFITTYANYFCSAIMNMLELNCMQSNNKNK